MQAGRGDSWHLALEAWQGKAPCNKSIIIRGWEGVGGPSKGRGGGARKIKATFRILVLVTSRHSGRLTFAKRLPGFRDVELHICSKTTWLHPLLGNCNCNCNSKNKSVSALVSHRADSNRRYWIALLQQIQSPG